MNPNTLYADSPFRGIKGVAVKDCHAYVSTYPGALQVLGLSDREAPRAIGAMYRAGSSFSDPVVSGDYVYVACGYEGLLVLAQQCDPTSGITKYRESEGGPLLEPRPSVTRGQTTVQWQGGSGSGKLRALDPSGRCLLDREVTGDRVFVDFRRLGFPAGVYWIVLDDASGERSTSRVVLVR